ncbi:hypothetical protein WJX73_010917 [Symbiochloris irregularis]|uniref:F-box domain-containing protein n=1 Tax=Symbiochloris irregularis TaxID=706552 RepID=A0AAW1PD79_9CHLO
MQSGEHPFNCTGRHSRWDGLQPELLTTIFSRLELRDLLRVELCCRSWRDLLRALQARGLYGSLHVELDKLPLRILQDRVSTIQAFLPLCQFLQAHAPGISGIDFTTEWCNSCTGAEASACITHCCKSSPDMATQGLVLLMSALQGRPLDVRVKLGWHRRQTAWSVATGAAPAWPVQRHPMLQEIFVQHPVSLSLPTFYNFGSDSEFIAA